MELYLDKQQIPLSPMPRLVLLFPKLAETSRLEVVDERVVRISEEDYMVTTMIWPNRKVCWYKYQIQVSVMPSLRIHPSPRGRRGIKAIGIRFAARLPTTVVALLIAQRA